MALEFLGGNQLPERYDGILRIGNLNTHGCFSRNRRFNSHISHGQIQLDIIGQAYDLIDLDALIRLKLIAGHGRTLAYIRDRYTNAEVPENLLQMKSRLMQNPICVFILCMLHLIQQTKRRINVFLRKRCRRIRFLRHCLRLLCRFHCRHMGRFRLSDRLLRPGFRCRSFRLNLLPYFRLRPDKWICFHFLLLRL